jgi:hypothetical protein
VSGLGASPSQAQVLGARKEGVAHLADQLLEELAALHLVGEHRDLQVEAR